MKISLNKRSIENGNKWSWYIQYYFGSTYNEKGKRKHIRDFKYLEIYTLQNPLNDEEKKHNEELERTIHEIFRKEEINFLNGNIVGTNSNSTFIDSVKSDINYAIEHIVKNRNQLNSSQINKLMPLLMDNQFLVESFKIKFYEFSKAQQKEILKFIVPFISEHL